MKWLGSPAGVAVCAILLAAAVHPWTAAYRLETSGIAVVVLMALVFTLAAILRGLADVGTAVLGLGVSLIAAAGAYDALRGHQGELLLRPGEGRQAFEERGPAGTRLGLRPRSRFGTGTVHAVHGLVYQSMHQTAACNSRRC